MLFISVIFIDKEINKGLWLLIDIVPFKYLCPLNFWHFLKLQLQAPEYFIDFFFFGRPLQNNT